MKSILSTALLAACAGLAALALPATSHAANVGYTTQTCWGGNPSTLITQAGHTPVAINTDYAGLTAANLVGLQGLVIGECGNRSINTNVDAALSAGLVLFMDNWSSDLGIPYPGNRSLSVTGGGGGSIHYPTVAPWRTGPAGYVSDNALDGIYTNTTFQTLPVDVTVMATQTSDGHARVISYPVGTSGGKVLVSTFASNCLFPGGGCGSPSFGPGLQALTTNLIAWGTTPAFVSCAAEGFVGSKLTLCRKICETTQTSTTMTSLIRLYTATYRQTPPCAR